MVLLVIWLEIFFKNLELQKPSFWKTVYCAALGVFVYFVGVELGYRFE